MNKPAFDPNQPFTSAKPEFDPNQPFTATGQEHQQTALDKASEMSQSVQDAVLQPLGRASDTAARGFSNLAFGSEKPAEYAEQGVGLVGKGIQKLGEDVAGGTGYIAQRFANATGAGGQNMAPTDYAAALAGTATSMIPQLLLTPEAGKSAIAEEAAQDLGRRSLGINKGMLKRLKGGIPQANQAAQEMLDQGVIRPFSGAKATLDRAEDVAATSGKAVGDALASAGQHALDTNQVSEQVINQLAPEFKGGAYHQAANVANEIVDTIQAHGSGPIDFESAQKLKNTLKTMAGNNWNTDKTKAAMYQRAYGIVSDAMEKAVEEANPSAAPSYIRNKQIYGASQTAIKGLEDKSNAEASNSLLSLRGAAIGAGALASGHITPALEALGAWEAARRVGAGTGAYALNAFNAPLSQAAKKAVMAEFISRITTKQNQGGQ